MRLALEVAVETLRETAVHGRSVLVRDPLAGHGGSSRTTSANGTVIGADGLCTVDGHHLHAAASSRSSAMRAASVSMRFSGSPPTDLDDALGDLAVVHGVGDVVGSRPPARVSTVQASTSTTKSWPSRRSVLEDPVVAERAHTGQRDLV